MTACRYVEGPGLAVVTSHLAVLLPAGDLATARAVQAGIEAGGGSPQILQAIAVGSPLGLGELPDFAVVAWHADVVQVFVRGPLGVAVEAVGGRIVIDGTDVVTWREQTVRGAMRCDVGPADGWAMTGLPLTDGTVRAAGFVLARSTADLLPTELPEDAGGPEEHVAAPEMPVVPGAESVPVITPEPLLEPTPRSALERAPAPVVEPAPLLEDPGAPAGDPSGVTIGGSPLVDGGALTLAEAQTRLPDADEVAPDPAVRHESGYDHLWGATQLRSVEEAAVRVDEEEGGTAGDAWTDGSVHDGETIGPAALAALRAARVGGEAHLAGPPEGTGLPLSHGVLARMCLSGHSNPPARADCWVCGRAVEGDASRRARPPLGRMRLATGESVELDASYVVGRRPKASRVSGEVPRVLAVQSPEGEVSASHLAIRLEDWHVLAVDQSRNGTVLFRQGEDPRRLQPEVPMILRSGDVLDLGDGAVLTFEGLP